MFNYDFTLLLFVVSSLIAIGCALLFFKDRKKVHPAFAKAKTDPAMPILRVAKPDFPVLIDRPLLALSDEAVLTIEKEKRVSETHFQPVEDEESALLKAAEIVVEKVQNAVNNIASSPPNSEEVLSKIKAIVNPYSIFKGTEYFDAVNSFIAITVERDCELQLTKEELLALWG